ncbi:MAG: hypothetical protein [Bacteriophage sp.]|nr:MAG: hypothetical protein [Bacteriophage sp.]
MSRKLMVFKKPSNIIFKAARPEPEEVFTIRDAKRGNTFLHRGAVCMLSEVSAYRIFNNEPRVISFKEQEALEDILRNGIFITNLQTGRTFAVKHDDEIEWSKVTMTVESE